MVKTKNFLNKMLAKVSTLPRDLVEFETGKFWVIKLGDKLYTHYGAGGELSLNEALDELMANGEKPQAFLIDQEGRMLPYRSARVSSPSRVRSVTMGSPRRISISRTNNSIVYNTPSSSHQTEYVEIPATAVSPAKIISMTPQQQRMSSPPRTTRASSPPRTPVKVIRPTGSARSPTGSVRMTPASPTRLTPSRSSSPPRMAPRTPTKTVRPSSPGRITPRSPTRMIPSSPVRSSESSMTSRSSSPVRMSPSSPVRMSARPSSPVPMSVSPTVRPSLVRPSSPVPSSVRPSSPVRETPGRKMTVSRTTGMGSVVNPLRTMSTRRTQAGPRMTIKDVDMDRVSPRHGNAFYTSEELRNILTQVTGRPPYAKDSKAELVSQIMALRNATM